MIELNNISKKFGNISALINISLKINKGEIFGLIGPDGAGKTTLFRIMTTLLLPDNGNGKIFDYDLINNYKEIRKNVGYIPGKFSLYQDLTVEENLNFFAAVFNTTVNDNYYLIKNIYEHIKPFKDRKAGALSGGMKQKLALSCALIHKPKILFLDEPTTGVDPVSRNEFWEILKIIQAEEITILVSTPFMNEVALCDKIALINNGNILAIDSTDNLINNYKHTLYAVKSNENPYKLLNDLREFDSESSVIPFGEYFHLVNRNNIDITESINKYLINKSHSGIIINTIQPEIEDVFIDLMRKNEN